MLWPPKAKQADHFLLGIRLISHGFIYVFFFFFFFFLFKLTCVLLC